MSNNSFNMTAFGEGLSARTLDAELGTLTDNPYNKGTLAFHDWYKGYNTPPYEEIDAKLHANDPECPNT